MHNGSLNLPKNLKFTNILKQLWAIIIAKLQLDEYESGYFHEILIEYYCLDKTIHLGH